MGCCISLLRGSIKIFMSCGAGDWQGQGRRKAPSESMNRASKVAKGSFGPAYADQIIKTLIRTLGWTHPLKAIPKFVKKARKGTLLQTSANGCMTHRRAPPIVSGQFVKLVVNRQTLIQNAGTFPGQSPTAIKENPIFRRVFDQALKDDPTFANEVQRLKKRRDRKCRG